jgi:hypothetical protein
MCDAMRRRCVAMAVLLRLYLYLYLRVVLSPSCAAALTCHFARSLLPVMHHTHMCVHPLLFRARTPPLRRCANVYHGHRAVAHSCETLVHVLSDLNRAYD